MNNYNPMQDLEDRKSQFDMGILSIRVFQGASSEAKNRWEAVLATAALFIGMFSANYNQPEQPEQSDV